MLISILLFILHSHLHPHFYFISISILCSVFFMLSSYLFLFLVPSSILCYYIIIYNPILSVCLFHFISFYLHVCFILIPSVCLFMFQLLSPLHFYFIRIPIFILFYWYSIVILVLSPYYSDLHSYCYSICI